MIKFGVAGNSKSFFADGLSTSIQAADWCAKKGIDCYEYSFGRGVNLSSETAVAIGNAFENSGVELSVHAPYFINFSNPDPEKIENSIGYVTRSIEKLICFKGNRVVVHPASQGKAKRDVAHTTAIENFKLLSAVLEEKGLTNYKVCIETMGKIGQMGSVAEVVDYCNVSEQFYPCVDFGHVNSRELGSLKETANYTSLLSYMLDNLPEHKVFDMHIHFSKIQYGAKGELKHLTFEDEIYGPNYEHMLEAVYKLGLEPYIICESDGTQAEDTLTMKNHFKSF
ncbi:MAG: TIM barrel protein [Bacillota bacterium]